MKRLKRLRAADKDADEHKDDDDGTVEDRFDKIKLYRESIKKNIVASLLKSSVTKAHMIYPVTELYMRTSELSGV